MRAFEYVRPADVAGALSAAAEPGAAFLSGGTTQLDLMKDGIWSPHRLVDISRLPMRGTTVRESPHGPVLEVGSLTTMEQLAADPAVAAGAPLVREALLAGASTQLRNMATIGGNLLQRTRCRYFRDPDVGACNRRRPGSGCAAVTGVARMHAVLGVDERCIAAHPSDLAVALAALDATIQVTGPGGDRRITFAEFYVPAVDDPAREHTLAHGELITSVGIPLLPDGWRSGYLKVRDRASYEFAVVSTAAALRVTDGVIREARIAFGGVGSVPWRAPAAERSLRDQEPSDAVFRAAAEATMAGAYTVPGTAFKPELAVRALIRHLRLLTGLSATVLA